jgi:hypothetical protein
VIALAAALWLAPPLPTPPPQAPFGRIWTTANVHVGVRPHFLATPDELGAGITLQLSVNAL